MIDVAKELFLFHDMGQSEIDTALRSVKYEVAEYRKGEFIFTPDDYSKKIGFILSGYCEVQKIHGNESCIPMNRLNRFDSFGIIAAVGAKEQYPMHICSKTETTILFLTSDELYKLFDLFPITAKNTIHFLANKIEFLCGKISAFSADNIEQKIATHIFNIYKSCGKRTFLFNRKRTAEALNLGRTSLYRALDNLIADGIIELNEKLITIIDPDGLERMTK